MTASYKELLAQREVLETQIRKARAEELEEVLRKIGIVVKEFDLTPDDIFPLENSGSNVKRAAVAPKYRNPSTGATWTGRGKPPAWIAGQNRDLFLIAT